MKQRPFAGRPAVCEAPVSNLPDMDLHACRAFGPAPVDAALAAAARDARRAPQAGAYPPEQWL